MNQYSWIPQWLRPTSTSKCISAYVLGVIIINIWQNYLKSLKYFTDSHRLFLPSTNGLTMI
jgi:hypothetical protein